MQFSQEQYHRFLTNQCSEEERAAITAWFAQHPELLEQWLQIKDWEQYSEDMHVHPAFAQRMRTRFLDHIQQQQGKQVRLHRIRIAAAVVALLSVPFIWLLLKQPAAMPVAALQKIKPAAPAIWQVIHNDHHRDTIFLLNDHSLVTLFAHSTLRYKKVFDHHQRDLYLIGAAHFSVAKDKTKPFTVFAKGIATTALGTKFTIRTNTSNKNVQVQLQEGRVMVRAATTQAGHRSQTVYLWPGDELLMNSTGHQFLKRSLPVIKQTGSSVKKNKPQKGDALSFQHTPLVQVLEQLQQRFGAAIRFNPAELNEIFVTASFTEQDTLSGILDILCTLNNLRLQRTGNAFNISR